MKTLRTYVIGEPEELIERHGGDILSDPRYLELKKNHHHVHTTTYEHCYHVTLIALRMAKNLRMKVDIHSLIRACLLHDYYGYDNDHKPKKHLRRHGATAAKRADLDFGLNGIEHDTIRNHMWPIHPFLPPLSREGWLCMIADKVASTREYFRHAIRLASRKEEEPQEE